MENASEPDTIKIKRFYRKRRADLNISSSVNTDNGDPGGLGYYSDAVFNVEKYITYYLIRGDILTIGRLIAFHSQKEAC